ncbi:MAG: DUF421 domain-containing protein [Peptococcaceae bacterium]|nr:DUF421 domain-containing protein [Peptococcaceae bacterium]
MFIGILRTLILYIIIVLVLRVMGKRQIGQLQPFELVVVLMVAELATIPSQDIGVPLMSGLLPLLALCLAGLVTSRLSMKSHRIRNIVCGMPTLVINRGVILEQALRQQSYNLSDLFEQLRTKDIFYIGDIEYAVLETNGELSVVLKSAKRPATPEDLNLKPADGVMPIALIMDGKLQGQNLRSLGLETNWLIKNLRPFGTEKFSDVFVAYCDADKNLFVQLKDKRTP